MLQWAHRTVLEDVARGDQDTPPALDDLLATGLVARDGDRLVVTDAGRAALEAGMPTRWERVAWVTLAVCGVVLAAASVL